MTDTAPEYDMGEADIEGLKNALLARHNARRSGEIGPTAELCFRAYQALTALQVRALKAEEERDDAIGAAEREVGRWVYRRIERLMDAKAGTPEEAELQLLAHLAESIEEYGEENCADSPLSSFLPPSATERSEEGQFAENAKNSAPSATDQRVREADKARLDWLETKVVNVREPLPHGSRDLFWAEPDDSFEGEDQPSDLRARIDAFMLSASPLGREPDHG